MSVRHNLMKLGVHLPDPPQPQGAYTRAVRSGALLFVAGQLPIRSGNIEYTGKLGNELDTKAGYQAARLCAINSLSILNAETSGLDAVRLIRIAGYVASTPDFTDHALVVNGASDLFGAVFEDNGIHARLAIGVAALPLGAAVELEVIAEIL